MKITYVVPHYFPQVGGVETHVRQLARGMAQRGHRVEVLGQEADDRRPALEEHEGVLIRRFRPLPRLPYEFAPALWRYLIRRHRALGVVHGHNYHHFPALGAALFADQPLIFTPHYHGTGHTPRGRALHVPYRAAGRLMFSRADAIICVSAAEAGLVRQDFPVGGERLTIIPNGVDAAAIRRAGQFAEKRPVILTVGRLEQYKNIQRAIEALALLENGYLLVVVGDGPARRDLEATARRLGMEGNVRFTGNVTDEELFRWYRTAGVCLSLSEQEAFGITLLEGLAGGGAVVATDIPAHREVAVSVGSGRLTLAPVSISAEELATLIKGIVARPRAAGPPTLLPDWDLVCERTEEVYERVTARVGEEGAR